MSRLARRSAAASAWWAAVLSTSVFAGAIASVAHAHVAWPSSYSTRVTIAASDDGLLITVTAEIPTLSLVPRFRHHFKDKDLKAEIEAGRFAALEDEFRDYQFTELARGLETTINGELVDGRWLPVDTPINGRSNEGFFVYILQFSPTEPVELGRRLEVEVNNHLFERKPLVLSNLVQANDGWQAVEASTEQPPEGADLSPGSVAEMALWAEDEDRRSFRVVLVRSE